MPPFEFEKREFIRVRQSVRVRYKFLSKSMTEPEFEPIYEGTTENLSGGGLLLLGKVPKSAWLTDLLTHKILIGINLCLPAREDPIKALTKVSWIESADEKSMICKMGLQFRDITTHDKDSVFQFVIRSQISIEH